MMPPTTTGTSTPLRAQEPDGLGHQAAVRSREHRETDEVDVFVARDRRDLLGRQPDALVHDLHPGVARRHRDLLGAVRVAVEPGLAHEDADGMTERLGAVVHLRACSYHRIPGRRVRPPPTPVGARYSPNTSRSAPAHSPTVPPARASAIVAGVEVVGAPRRVPHRRRAPPRPRRRRARRATRLSSSSWSRSACSSTTRMLLSPSRLSTSGDAAGLGERVDPDDDDVAGLDAAHPLGVALHEPLLHGVDHGERPAAVEHPLQLGVGRLGQLGGLALDHVRTGEQVVVLEEIGLEREHLLDAQRPLLVPGPGESERLVPRRQLHRARPGALRERDAERLQHDARHVVLGLRLGEPERVDLHAVAEPAQLVVGDAVALGA